MSQQDPVELEDLVEEYIARCRAGESPRIEDYARAHPDLADEIRDLFPAIVAMEDIKSEREARHERQAWAGPGVDRLGDFRLVRELGRGGMGIVYEAEQESLGRRVAVKILPRPALLRGHARERFEREARTAAKLHHTNIVPVFGVGHYEDYHFLVMQYIAGIGLDEILRALRARQENPLPTDEHGGFDLVAIGQGLVQRRDREMPRVDNDATRTNYGSLDSFASAATTTSPVPEETERPAPLLGRAYYRSIAQIGVQVADALAYAHQQGTLHRDIKPGNLLLDADGTVWVADFGLAKAIDQDSVTHSGDFVGTLRYMAPEQFDGATDSRSDIYSIGLTLHELITLRPAFADSTHSLRTGQIGDRAVVPARRLNPHVPLDLETIVQKAVSHDPGDRYQTADELALDLRLFLEERPIRARRITTIERLYRWSKRNRELAALLGTTIGLLFTIAALTSYGYLQAKQAATRIAAARDKETQQRERAEQTVDLTLGVLDRVFDEFAPSRFTNPSSGGYGEDEDETAPIPIRPVLSPARVQLLNHMLEVFQQLAAQESDDLGVRRKAGDAYRRVAAIQQQLGHYEEAREAYQRASVILSDLASEFPYEVETVIAARTIGTALGEMEFQRNQPRDAVENLQQTLRDLTDLPAELLNAPLARYERARALYLLARYGNPPGGPGGFPSGPGSGAGPGRLFSPGDGPPGERRERPGRGERPGRRARGDFRPGDGPPGERRAGFGPFSERRGDGPPGRPSIDIESHLNEASELLGGLIEEFPEQPEYRHLLAQCDTLPHRRRGQDSDRFERGVQLLEDLSREFPDVPEYQLDLAQAYAFGSRAARGEGGFDGPRRFERMQTATRLVKDLIKQRPGIPQYESTLVRIHGRHARLLGVRNRSTESLRTWKEAVDLQESLATRYPEVPSYRGELAMVQRSYAEQLLKSDQTDNATEFFQRAYESARDASASNRDNGHLRRIEQEQLARLISHMKRQDMPRNEIERLEGLQQDMPGPRERRRD